MRIADKLGKPISETAYLTAENVTRYRAILRFFYVRLAAHVANGCKFQIRPSSGKDTAKTKGVLFMATTMINARGI